MATCRLLLYAAMGALVVTADVAAIARDRADASAPSGEPRDGMEPPRQRFHISEDTTRLVEPLTPDGFVDFAAALNRQYGKGVTPENNAVVALWNVFGPESTAEELRAGFFGRLGMPVPRPDGEYFVELPSRWDDEEFHDQLAVAIAQPWARRQFPKVAGWLEQNCALLPQLVEGSRRDRFFEPIEVGPVEWFTGERVNAGLVSASSQSLLLVRTPARALLAQAMLCLESGEFDAAREGLVAAHRWSRLAGQDPDSVAWLTSVNLERLVIDAETSFILDQRLPPDQIAQLGDALKHLPPRPDLAERFDRWERFLFIDVVCHASAGHPLKVLKTYNDLTWIEDRQLQFVAFEDRPGLTDRVKDRLTGMLITSFAGWNAILRDGNRWYDRVVAAVRLSGTERRTAAAELRAEWGVIRALGFPDREKIQLAQWIDGFTAPRVWPHPPLHFPITTLRVVREEIHEMFLSLLLRAPHQYVYADDQAEARFRMLTITLALAAHRQQHGRFPDQLEALAPGAGALPVDPFSDEPFRHRSTEKGFLLYSVGPNGRDDGGRRGGGRLGLDGPDDIISRWPRPAPDEAP